MLIPTLDRPEKPSPLAVLTALAAERMRRQFSLFARRAWHIVEPKPCVWSWHMDAICEHLVYVTQGEIRFLGIEVPPRTSKSLLSSVLWPAWHWAIKPETQFITASYERNLALSFSVLSRRLIESAWYKQFYGNEFFILSDENQKQAYTNSKGGYRITTSVDGKTTGLGGDIQLLDDPLNARDAESEAKLYTATSWHDNAWRSRVNDPNKSQKVYIAQRLRDNDIMGHVREMEGHRWVWLTLPMEFDKRRICITYKNDGTGVKPDAVAIFQDPRKIEGELLNPKRFNAVTAQAEKDGGMSDRAWNAQMQQQPEGQGGLILKRKWWRQWVYPEWHALAFKERPLPEFIEIIQVYDTALEEDEEAAFNARTTWGIFAYQESEKDPKTGRVVDGRQRICAILLDMMEQRLDFPSLREEVISSYNDFKPDYILVEKKASGHGLVHELRRKNLPVKAVKLTDGKDKVARTKTASLVLEKGCIFYVPRKWALHVIDRAAKFPSGQHKDLVDTLSIAWMYMRRHSDLTLPDDELGDEIAPFTWKRANYG